MVYIAYSVKEDLSHSFLPIHATQQLELEHKTADSGWRREFIYHISTTTIHMIMVW